MNIIKDKNEWNSVLINEFGNLDNTNSYQYFDLYRKHYDTELECIYWENKVLKIFWPHLIRDLSKIKYFSNFSYYDLTLPYGHYGPLVIIKNKDEVINKSIKEFYKIYDDYAKKNRYVCEFMRFHPIFENWKFFPKILNVEHVSDTVIINLKDNLPKIWRDMNQNTRRYIRKSRSKFENVIIKQNPSEEEIKDFFILYNKTMKKNAASQKYFFSYDFIKDHFSVIKSVLIYCINKSNKIGSSAIIYKDFNVLNFLLGATNYFFNCSPLRFVIWETIKWGKDEGFEYLYLGGGKTENDSLFKFKRGFSRITCPLYIGKKIFNKEIYNRLISISPIAVKDSEYFPSYRVGIDENIV